MAACIGKAFNVDGCIIALPDANQSVTQIVCWLADAPPIPLKTVEATPDLFEVCSLHQASAQTEKADYSDVETIQSHSVSTLSVSKFLQLWESMGTLRVPLPQVKAVISATTQLARARQWSY